MSSESLKPILVYTGAASPNASVVTAYLDSLKKHYPGTVEYECMNLDRSKLEQKEPWYIEINPNGRIPAIIDRSRGDFVVIESSAILLYLAQQYDKNYIYWFNPQEDTNGYSEMIQWIFWAHGGPAPTLTEFYHYAVKAPEKLPYAQKRYRDEARRLYGVLELRLTGRDYLAGAGRGKYSLADARAFPWVEVHPRISIPTLEEWPSLRDWADKCKSQ